MHSYFFHVYKFKDVHPAIIFASKYLRAKFLLLPMWVFSRFPMSTHIFGEYPQQEADPKVVINTKNTT